MKTPAFARLTAFCVAGILSGFASTSLFAITASVISPEKQKSILSNPGTAVLGTSDGDITVVEYFDYNCPYCRKLAPNIHELVGDDKKVNVIFKEWPIFGGISIYAARSALAAQWQGKYLAAHDALIGAPRLSQAAEVDATLRNAGIDMAELQKTLAVRGAEIDAILARNDAEAHSLGIRGTPGLLVGRNVATGIGDLATLKKAVAQARGL